MNTKVTKVALVMVLVVVAVGQALAVEYVRHTAPAEYPGAPSPKWAGVLDLVDDLGGYLPSTPELGLNTEEGPLPSESEYFEGDRVTITANLPDYVPGCAPVDIYVFSVILSPDGLVDSVLVWPGAKVGYDPSLYGPGPYGGPISGNLVATHQEDLDHDDPGVVTRRVPIMDFVYGSAFPSDLTVYNVVKVVPAGAYPFWSHHWFTNEAGEWVQGDPYWVNLHSIHTITLRAGESPLDNLEAPEYVRLRSGEPREIVLSSTVELGDNLVRALNEAGFDVVVNNGYASGSITLTARDSVPNGTLVPFVFRLDGHREVVWVCKNDADIEPRDVTATMGVDVTSNEVVGDRRQLEVWVGNETTRFNMQFGGRVKQVFSQDVIKAKRDYPDNLSRINIELPSSMQDSHFHLAFITEDGSYIQVRGQKGYPEEIAERPTVTPSIITIDGSEDPPYYLRSTGGYASVEVIVTSDDFRIVRDESYTGEGDRWIIQLIDPHATGEVPYSFEFVFSDEDGDVIRIVRGEIHIEADPGSGGTEEPVPGDEGDGEGPAITIVGYSPPSVTTETEAFTVNFTVEDSDGVGDVHVTYDMGGERIATFALSDDGSNLVKTSDTGTSCTYRFSAEPTGEVGEFHYSIVAFDSYGSRTEHDAMVPVVGPEDEDLLPPEITNIRINGVLTNSRHAYEPRVVISGEVYDDVSGVATTHLELSGATSMTTPTVADNSFSWELNVGVGGTTGEIIAVDNAGREARVPIEITYHPPVAEMVITAPLEIYEETAVTLTATGAAGSQWIWKVDGEEVVSAGYTATPSAGSLQITFPDSGWYTVSVETRNDDGILFGGASRAVQVLEVDEPVVPTPVVSVSGPTAVVEGESISLSASTSGGSDPSYTWATLSGGSFVALSSATGTSITVTGVSAGTVQLRATGVDTGVSATHTVTVVAGVTPTVVISGPGTVEVASGITLTATTVNGPDSGYSWSQVGGSGSVSISGSGSSVTVTGVSAGAVTIQATGNTTGVSDAHEVQVSNPVSYRVGISGPANVTVGSGITLTATTTGMTEAYTWSVVSGGVNVNVLDNYDGTLSVTGVSVGTTVIRATGDTTGNSDDHVVSVLPSGGGETVVVSGPSNLGQGETAVYTAATTGGSDSGYTWVSTNPSVATVTADGSLTAVSIGTTTLRATGHDTGVTGQMVVTVQVATTAASIGTWDGSSASLEVPVGTSFTPGVRVENADGSGLQGVSVTVWIYIDGALYTGGTAPNPQTTNTLVDGVARFGTNSWQLTEPGCFGFRFVVEREGSPDLVSDQYRYTPGEYVAMPAY